MYTYEEETELKHQWMNGWVMPQMTETLKVTVSNTPANSKAREPPSNIPFASTEPTCNTRSFQRQSLFWSSFYGDEYVIKQPSFHGNVIKEEIPILHTDLSSDCVFATFQLIDHVQMASILWASVSPPVKWRSQPPWHRVSTRTGYKYACLGSRCVQVNSVGLVLQVTRILWIKCPRVASKVLRI